MTYRWETSGETSGEPSGSEAGGSVWLEDDQGRFALAASAGLGDIDWQEAQGRLQDIAQLLGASLPGACRHAPIYPEGFAFCPVCGAALERRAASPQPEWWGVTAERTLPKYVAQGLPVTRLPLAAAIERRPLDSVPGPDLVMPAVPNAECVFAAASFGFAAQRLLALAYGRQVLQYWDPVAALWQIMAPEDGAAGLGFDVSDYAWLPAAVPRRGEVALVPTAQGLFRLWINPLNHSYRTEPVFRAALAGAPGRLRQRIACLFLENGRVCLWSARPDGADPQQLDCAGDAVPGAGWSRPLAYDEKLMWLHAQGQLVWRPGAAPRWLPWPQGWTPRLAFGAPAQSRDGRIWQIGHGRQGYCFLELGVEIPQSRACDGARLGFGSFLFRRGHPVLDDPWEAETVEDQSEADTLVVPLLQQFNGVRNQPAGLVLRLDPYTGTAEAALADTAPRTIRLEWIGRRNIVLDQITDFKRLTGALPFVYDNCLWLHHPQGKTIRGWRLAPLS